MKVNEWCDVWIAPRSPVAQYCVVRKNNQRTQELLEKTAAEVVRATEAVAQQNVDIHRQQRARLSGVYVPVIVTTARLSVCDFDPSRFDPAAGEIPGGDFNEVGMVRFAKSFSHPTSYGNAAQLEDVAAMSGHSVLIVQSQFFPEFLMRWQFDLHHELAGVLWGS
jgi:hypothetical protein